MYLGISVDYSKGHFCHCVDKTSNKSSSIYMIHDLKIADSYLVRFNQVNIISWIEGLYYSKNN